MSARIKVTAEQWRYRNSVLVDDAPPFSWTCTECERTKIIIPARANTVHAAATDGMRHLRDHHPEVVWAAGGNVYQAEDRYERRCGVRTADCEAQTCSCASVDPGDEKVAQRCAQDHDLDCCTHDNPLQAAHNQSREDC